LIFHFRGIQEIPWNERGKGPISIRKNGKMFFYSPPGGGAIYCIPRGPRTSQESVWQEARGPRPERRSEDPLVPLLRSERKQGFSAEPFYGRARCSPLLGAFKTSRTYRNGIAKNGWHPRSVFEVEPVPSQRASRVSQFRAECDQICTTKGPKVNSVRRADF